MNQGYRACGAYRADAKGNYAGGIFLRSKVFRADLIDQCDQSQCEIIIINSYQFSALLFCERSDQSRSTRLDLILSISALLLEHIFDFCIYFFINLWCKNGYIKISNLKYSKFAYSKGLFCSTKTPNPQNHNSKNRLKQYTSKVLSVLFLKNDYINRQNCFRFIFS